MRKRVIVGLLVLSVLAGLLIMPTVASAATSSTVTISATPSYLCMTLTYNDAHDDSWAVGTVAESSTYWWDDEGGAQATPDFPLPLADCAGIITNCGSVASDVDVHGHSFTGGVGWTITTGAPGENSVQITAYEAGCANEAAGIEVDTGDLEFLDNRSAGNATNVELSLETGTFTDGVAKSSSVTFTIRSHS